jgi:hypothetical protein
VRRSRVTSGRERHRGDDYAWLPTHRPPQPASGAVVQQLVPSVLDDELGYDDGQGEIVPLLP